MHNFTFNNHFHSVIKKQFICLFECAVAAISKPFFILSTLSKKHDSVLRFLWNSFAVQVFLHLSIGAFRDEASSPLLLFRLRVRLLKFLVMLKKSSDTNSAPSPHQIRDFINMFSE